MLGRLDPSNLKRALGEWFDGRLARATFAGGELLVMQNGQELCRIAGGVADARTGRRVGRKAMYRLASMTKPVTGLAALVAVREGWFSLDDEVRNHLQEFDGMDVGAVVDGKVVRDRKARGVIHIWQLLSHCSGVLAGTEIGGRILSSAPPEAFGSLRDSVSFAASQPLSFDPGEGAAYSAYAAFDAVARIIEIKSGMRYSEFLSRFLFTPLGIVDTTFHPTPGQWRRMVAMHDRTESGGLAVVELPHGTVFEGFPDTYECAGAGLAGTMDDFAKIAQLMCNQGSVGGVTLVDADLFREFAKPRVPDGVPGRAPNDSWGLGVCVKVRGDRLPEGCFGWSGAYGTHFWVDPGNGIVAILMRNMRWHDTHGAGETGAEFERIVMSCLERKLSI